MAEFTKVAKTAELQDQGKLLLEVQDRLVVLLYVDGQYYCIDDVCTHDGGPLGEGQLCGFELACPRHGAKFDIRTGDACTMPATEKTAVHEVKLVDDEIFIRILE
jgi:3-phenylpropionate/trans-cinnamate dioxygenase ferredoxin subunit